MILVIDLHTYTSGGLCISVDLSILSGLLTVSTYKKRWDVDPSTAGRIATARWFGFFVKKDVTRTAVESLGYRDLGITEHGGV